MRADGINDSQNQLSADPHMESSGEAALVPDAGRVVGESAPPAREIADERKADLVRRGIITPAVIERRGPPRRTPSAPLAEILKELDDDRGGR